MNSEQRQILLENSFTSVQLDIVDRFIRITDMKNVFKELNVYVNNPLKVFTEFMNHSLVFVALDLDDEISQIISSKPEMIRYKIYNKLLDDLEGGVDIDTVDYREVIDTIIREHQVIDTPFHHTIPIIAKNVLQKESGILDIYVSRKQTPAFIMHDITFNTFTNALRTYSSSKLVSFGVLCLTYDTHKIDIYTCNKHSATMPFADIHDVISNPEMQNFIVAIFKKIFLDSLLRRQNDDPFKQYFTIDLYNRSKGQTGFHQDSFPDLHIDYFTLTYVINDPSKTFKGPTIISHTETSSKKQCNLVVGHGTTIGLDNRVLYHSTPEPHINQDETNTYIPYFKYFNDKKITIREQDHSRFNPSLLTVVAENTAQIDRCFFRSWYYDTPADDIKLTLLTTIELDKELRDEMRVQRGITQTDYADADILIDDLLQTNTALGIRRRRKSKKGKKRKSIKLMPFILGDTNKRKTHKKHKKRIQKKL
jgi:hypothetical protein